MLDKDKEREDDLAEKRRQGAAEAKARKEKKEKDIQDALEREQMLRNQAK